MRADIHGGPEQTLQSEAGYIDARPHSRQIDENLLQHTAAPYIRVMCSLPRARARRLASRQLSDVTGKGGPTATGQQSTARRGEWLAVRRTPTDSTACPKLLRRAVDPCPGTAGALTEARQSLLTKSVRNTRSRRSLAGRRHRGTSRPRKFGCRYAKAGCCASCIWRGC